MKLLLTGCAGFIGMHVAKSLLDQQIEVLGIDNLNDYYDPELKNARVAELARFSNFTFKQVDIADAGSLRKAVVAYKPSRILHLAAQAGVRYSISNPQVYIQSNLVGFGNILELARHLEVEHLVFASSSSVYGANTKMPFTESDSVDHPVSLYAATKKANELMAHSYSHLYGLPVTGLRFFTVYGPWGRPDMSPWLFTKAILEGKSIDVFNNGNMERDFTYIDDIVQGTVASLSKIPIADPAFSMANPNPSASYAPYKIFNIGHNSPVKLLHFIELLGTALGRPVNMNFLPMQKGDVVATYANIDALHALTGYQPKVSLAEGLAQWADWYKWYQAR